MPTQEFLGYKSQISIHTLHTEGDLLCNPLDYLLDLFQSTPSTRRVTSHTYSVGDRVQFISIHTLHTEGDVSYIVCSVLHINFNPHPPHGG